MIDRLENLGKFLLDQRHEIRSWIEHQWQDRLIPFYCSMDIRDSGFKLACIDANLFPAGFNNVHPDCFALASEKLRCAATAFCDDLNGILLVAEKIDRNPFYLEHIYRLRQLLVDAGIPTRICRSDINKDEPRVLKSHSGQDVQIYSLERRGNRLYSGTWSPCAVLLNDDLSRASDADIAMYSDIDQTILPLPELGWFQRRKSKYFVYYNEVVVDFCNTFGIDGWLLNPLFRVCREIDFSNKMGLDCVAKHCEQMLEQIQQSYRDRDIKSQAMCFVKSDYGTHGLGIIPVEDPDQIYSLNRRQRKAMSYGKSGSPIDQVLIQECIPSQQLSSDQRVAEHVFYTVHNRVVGAFTRSHPEKSAYQNLNSPGMSFDPISLDKIETDLYQFQIVAILSLLAASREYTEISQNEAVLEKAEDNELANALARQTPLADTGSAVARDEA